MLVTGGSGFIGSYVVRHLSEVGALPVTVRSPHTWEAVDVVGDVIVADLGKDDVIYSAMRGVGAVVHLAARAGGIQAQHRDHADVFRDNVLATRQVLEAALRARVPRVFVASSAVVYGDAGGAPLRESAPKVSADRQDITGYAWSKLTDELHMRWLTCSTTEIVAGRFGNVYGPGATFDANRSTVVHALIKKAVDAGPDGALHVWGDGRAVRSLLYVEDAARAVLTVLARGVAAVAYNIDSSEAVTIRQLAEQVRDAVGESLELVFETHRPVGPRYRVLATDALRTLGFVSQVPVQTGILRTVDHYRRLSGN